MFTHHELTERQSRYLAEVRSALSRAPSGVRDRAACYATTLMENGFPVLFDQAHLAWATGVPSSVIAAMRRRPGSFYSEFRIPKRGGGSRVITAPSPALKQIQSWIHREIISQLEVHDACHGFVSGRSIVTNAEPHANEDIVLKLDLRDFFRTVDRSRVYRVFRRIGYSRDVARMLTALTTVGGALPQGAPTSPGLANVAAERLDHRLSRFCDRRQVVYTRYADDLTFSGELVTASSTKRTIERIIRDEGFIPHETKARYLGKHQRQSVTGIVVNDHVNWPRDRRRWLRQEVYYLSRYGVDEHLRRREVDERGYKEFVYGHVYALNMVRPAEAARYLKTLDGVDWPY